MRVAYLVVAFSSPYLVETIHSIPTGSRLLSFDNSVHDWPLAKVWNYGIDRLCRQEGYDAVIVCNDDIVLRPGTGDTLAQALAEHPELLVISARHTPLSSEPADDLGVGTCDFGCFCTSARLLDIVGPFDENLWPAFFEDNTAHWQIRVAGFEAASCGYAPYFHHHNGTIKHDPARRALVEQRFPRLRQYYIDRWGGPPGQERFTLPFNGQPGYVP